MLNVQKLNPWTRPTSTPWSLMLLLARMARTMTTRCSTWNGNELSMMSSFAKFTKAVFHCFSFQWGSYFILFYWLYLYLYIPFWKILSDIIRFWKISPDITILSPDPADVFAGDRLDPSSPGAAVGLEFGRISEGGPGGVQPQPADDRDICQQISPENPSRCSNIPQKYWKMDVKYVKYC